MGDLRIWGITLSLTHTRAASSKPRLRLLFATAAAAAEAVLASSNTVTSSGVSGTSGVFAAQEELCLQQHSEHEPIQVCIM